MHSHYKNSDPADAKRTLEEMYDAGLAPDLCTLRTLLRVYGKVGDMPGVLITYSTTVCHV